MVEVNGHAITGWRTWVVGPLAIPALLVAMLAVLVAMVAVLLVMPAAGVALLLTPEEGEGDG